MSLPRLMSGARTTGALHFGNYFGAVKNWIQLQSQYQCFFGVMDLHGLTTAYKSSNEINGWNRDMYSELLAWGIDPELNTLFVQSMVPELLELFYIFATITPMGWLERVPTWKDAEEEAKQNDTHNLGRFAYPVLMAADIALYLGMVVPVGQDQVAHLELNREVIRRFNHLYKAKLPEPKALLTETPVVVGLDGRKMSKSYGNTLFMTEEEKTLQKKVNGMVTDPARVHREDKGEPTQCPGVYPYHKLFSSSEDLKWVEEGCRSASIGCGDCKSKLRENINNLCAEPREKKKALLADKSKLDQIIKDSTQKARAEAQKNLKTIKGYMSL